MKPIGEFVLMYEDAETTTLRAFEVEERDGVRFVITTSGTSVGLTVQRGTALRWAHALLDLLEAAAIKSKPLAGSFFEDCFTPPRHPGEVWVSDMGRAYTIRTIEAGVYRAADFETGVELTFDLPAVGESFWRTLMEGGLKFSSPCPRCGQPPEVYDSPHGPIESCPRCQTTPPFPRRAR